MNLYHYTDYYLKEEIEKEGLVYRKKIEGAPGDTGELTYFLNKGKPEGLPSFLDRDKAVFFYLEEKDARVLGSHLVVIADTEKLDRSRLFVFNYEYVQRIWQDTADAMFSGKSSGIPLEETAKAYWESMMTYEEYLEKKPDGKYEALYFGEVSPESIRFENDKPFGVLQDVYDFVKEKSDRKPKIDSATSISFRHPSNQSRIEVWVDRNSSDVTVVRYFATLPEEVVEMFKEQLSYEDMIVRDDKQVVFKNASLSKEKSVRT